MREILKDYLREKRNYLKKVVIINDDKEYYTFYKDQVMIFNIIIMLKVRIKYKTIKNGIIINSNINILEDILKKLNIDFIILDSKRSMEKLYNKYLVYNDQMINKCENCKYFKNGDCYGIGITKKCKEFKKVNAFEKEVFNNIKADYSYRKNDGFLLLGSYCRG